MTYVVTPNSVAPPLNADSERRLFLTQNIKDPIVQQNFEQLNKIIAQLVSNRKVGAANLVIGPAYSNNGSTYQLLSGTALQKLGSFQVQIATRGNPVRLKLSPFNYSTSYPSYFYINDLNSTPGVGTGGLTMDWGWIRNGSIICKATTGPKVFDGTFGVQLLGLYLPLSTFEFDDVVPTGIYTYQFFFQLSTSTGSAQISNVNVSAYELR